jgi:hypothetical protein
MSRSGLTEALKTFLSSVPEASYLVVSAGNGAEITSVGQNEDKESMTDDVGTVTPLIPPLIVSAEQLKRLGLGSMQYSMTWCGRRIVLHMAIHDSLAVSILMEEGANLGLVDEYMDTLKKMLSGL